MRSRLSSPVAVGVISLVVVAVAVFLGFTKDIPFLNDRFELKAAFRESSGMREGSPVRIAGVEVGKVVKVEHPQPGARSVLVTMEILDRGLPIHSDAEAKIRPRIFLEGNFFVDVKPGTPASPALDSGGTIPLSRTANPVQFDEVLRALRSDVREQLRGTFVELGRAQEAGAGEAFNRSLEAQKAAYRWSAVVADALLGERPGDLAKLVRDTGTVAGAIDARPDRLRTLVTDFNRTAGALAASEADLRASVDELPTTLRTAMPALADLQAAFPAVRRLAAEARPGVRSTGPAAAALTPLVRQLRGLVGRRELRGLARDLRRATPPLAGLVSSTLPALEELRPLASCTEKVLVPFGNLTVPDAKFEPHGPIYTEAGKFLPGLAGESRSFDANGMWFKVQTSGGFETFDMGNGLFGTSAAPLSGVNPPPDRSMPPFRPDVPCETQQLPDLRTNPMGPPKPARRATTPALREQVRERTAKAREAWDALERVKRRIQRDAEGGGR